MKIEKIEGDLEIILSLICQYSGKISWYSLAKKSKLNIAGVLKILSEKRYITSEVNVIGGIEKEYFSITSSGENYLSNFSGNKSK